MKTEIIKLRLYLDVMDDCTVAVWIKEGHSIVSKKLIPTKETKTISITREK